MALVEEVITTTMTNLAPVFGTTPEEAHITASTNYFTVVCFHSVVVFVPMFVAWAWMLSRWDFSPLKVLLLFGITGSIAEASIQPSNLIGGFWGFVYGLMVYLPACTIPEDRPIKPPQWWHYCRPPKVGGTKGSPSENACQSHDFGGARGGERPAAEA